jgi:N-acetylneuraminic acid mutarotase
MDKSKFGLITLLLCFFGIFSSCEEESQITTSLITEEVIYLSGERARILGRIITNQNVEASDHGFYLSESESFSQPIVISLGERVAPGRFIGETSELDIQKKYFVKSFISLPEGIQFGNVLEVTTLSPDVDSFSPQNGPVGTTINIKGKNFTSDTRVFVGDREAQVIRIDFESSITAIIPASGTVALEELKVVVQNQEILFDDKFEYTTGKFRQLADFPFPVRISENIYFQDNSGFYFGLGSEGSRFLNPTIWKYNLSNNQWATIPFLGAPLWRAFSTPKYFGGGASAITLVPYIPSFDFWKIENGNFNKLPDLSFQAINTISFELNDKLYVFGGSVGTGNESYVYTANTGEWRKIANTPFPMNNTMANFNFGRKGYVINPENREIYLFDSDTDTWSYFGIFPGELGGGSALGITIGNRVFVGLANRSLQIWELNMETNGWVKKNNFTGSPIARNIATFVDNGLIYFIRNGEMQDFGSMEFWVFDPLAL